MREIVKIVINRGPRGLQGPAGQQGIQGIQGPPGASLTGQQIIDAIDAILGTGWRTGSGGSTAPVVGDGDGSIVGDGNGSLIGDPSE